MQMGIREGERRAEASETVWNFAVVGRGTERLFAELKLYIEREGGKVKYQRLSGYEFHVQEVLPENRLESESVHLTCGRCGKEVFQSTSKTYDPKALRKAVTEHERECPETRRRS
jgi:hypothetical protein